MREILFRGKTEDGKWEYGYPYEIYRNCHTRKVIAQPPDAFGKGKYTEIIDETLSQFTGLTDKNGTKIFEGDIVAYDVSEEGIQYANYAVIKWNENRIRYAVKWGGDCVDWLEKSDERYFRVAGNVFDNPELIGGADND